MGEVSAEQAAEVESALEARLLAALRTLWEGFYTIGYDPGRGCWWATRDGEVGRMVTAWSIEGLGDEIIIDIRLNL